MSHAIKRRSGSRQPLERSDFGRCRGREATLRNALIKSSSVPSASTSRARSMKRFDCSGSSGGGLGLRGMGLFHSSMKGSRNCRGSLGKLRPRRLRSRGCPHRPLALSPCATSRFVGQPPSLRALQGKRRALNIIDPKFRAVTIAEVKLCQVAMQVRLADMLIDAIDAALQY